MAHKHELARPSSDSRKFFGVGDKVQHADGWVGTITKVLGNDVFGVTPDDGGYYAASGLNLTIID